MAMQLPLMPHQVTMKDFIVTHPFCGIWLDIGGAKSLTTLAALEEIRPTGHILIIAPLAIARESWIDEIRKWGFPIRTRSLVVDEQDRRLSAAARKAIYEEFFTAPPTMYFLNQNLVDDLIDWLPKKNYGGWVIPVWPFPTVVIDEAHEFKNPMSVRFAAVKKVRNQIVRLIELTGSPSPQSLMDVWSQVYLLDEGLALGADFLEFREKYFEPTRFRNGEPTQWELRPGAEAEIHQRIKHLVISTENTSLPMPAMAPPEEVPVALDEDTLQAYRDFRRDQVIELATPHPNNPDTMIITADNAAILHGKLLQYASGSLYTGDNHDKDYAQIHEAKLRALGQIAEQARAAGDNLLVPYRYRSDKTVIPAYLMEHHGIPVEIYDGTAAMKKRWNDREIPVMLLQPASYGRGINLQQGGHEIVWYSMPDSLEQWDQTIGRLRRIGQPHPFVRVRYLVTQDTIDTRQILRLERKAATQDALLEAVRAEVDSDLQALNEAGRAT